MSSKLQDANNQFDNGSWNYFRVRFGVSKHCLTESKFSYSLAIKEIWSSEWNFYQIIDTFSFLKELLISSLKQAAYTAC